MLLSKLDMRDDENDRQGVKVCCAGYSKKERRCIPTSDS